MNLEWLAGNERFKIDMDTEYLVEIETGLCFYMWKQLWVPILYDDRPEMRLIVKRSSLLSPSIIVVGADDCLTIGRERSYEMRLRLAEMAVSRHHAAVYSSIESSIEYESHPFADFTLNEEEAKYIARDKHLLIARNYYIVDYGSTHGTFVNNERISEPKVQGQPLLLKHGDQIKIGSSKFEVHIPSSEETVCETCKESEEYPLYDLEQTGRIESSSNGLSVEQDEIPMSIDIRKEHRKQLRQLKNKFGVNGPVRVPKYHPYYKDRASKRREQVGSEPIIDKGANSKETEDQETKLQKPQPVYSEMALGIMKKMGYQEGSALGKLKNGVIEPIQLAKHAGKKGLGFKQK